MLNFIYLINRSFLSYAFEPPITHDFGEENGAPGTHGPHFSLRGLTLPPTLRRQMTVKPKRLPVSPACATLILLLIIFPSCAISPFIILSEYDEFNQSTKPSASFRCIEARCGHETSGATARH